MSAPEDSDEPGSSSPGSRAHQDADADGASGSNADADGATGSNADASGPTAASAVPVTLLEDACERLRIERRILTDERCALEQFVDRLVAIDGAVSTATVESHYRETVMAVPHYHAEYRDTYPESVAAEFGRTVAADLQRRERVDPATVDAIRRAAERGRASRDRVVDRIDAERHAVRAARDEIDAMREALASIAGTVDGTDGPALRSRCRMRLLLARCEELAGRRREQLGLATVPTTGAERKTDANGSDDPAPDRVAVASTADGAQPGQLQSLCYGELDTERPVLAVLAALRRAIRCRRRRSCRSLAD